MQTCTCKYLYWCKLKADIKRIDLVYVAFTQSVSLCIMCVIHDIVDLPFCKSCFQIICPVIRTVGGMFISRVPDQNGIS